MRLKYWHINGRKLIRTTGKCRICFFAKPKTGIFPFQNVGIDFAGRMLIRGRKTKTLSEIIKSYICLFICMATTVIHLECVTELATDEFLSFLRIFCQKGEISQHFRQCETLRRRKPRNHQTILQIHRISFQPGLPH